MEFPSSILNWISNKTSEASAYGIQKLAEIGVNPSDTLSKLVTLFIGAGILFLGLKVSQKIAKWIFIVLGILIVISIGYSFF